LTISLTTREFDQFRTRRNGAALSPEMGVFAPPSPFFKNV